MSMDALDVSDQMDDCIDNCFEAAEVTEACATRCSAQGDPDLQRCITLCRDVANVATTAAMLMSRNSENVARYCGLCADICQECLDECEKQDLESTQAVTGVLERCIESCREMAE